LAAAKRMTVASWFPLDLANTANTALYVLLLRRLPATSELAMIASRHPRHALIAQSGDEYRKKGRRARLG
jgi:hypothetical protein